MKRFRRQVMLSLYLGWMVCNAGLVHAAIYVCTDPQGLQTFTDRSCPMQRLYQPQPSVPRTVAPLHREQSKQLEALQKRTAKQQQSRQRSAQQQRRAQAKADDVRQQSCAQATTALRALADRRRRGYRLSQQPALEASETALKQQKRQNCS